MPSIEHRAGNGRGRVKNGHRELTAELRDVTGRLSEEDVAAVIEHLEALRSVMSFSIFLLSSMLLKRSDDRESKGGATSIVDSRWVRSALDRIVRERPTREGTQELGKLADDQIAELGIYFLNETADELARKRVSFPHGEEPDVESIGGSVEPGLVEAEEAARRLSERTLRSDEGQLLNSDELAERLGLTSRQSVHNWLHKGKIVGWRGAKRGYVFPAGQLNDRGMPVDGLERVVPYFGDGFAAWIWLTTPRSSLDGAEPLTLLSQGECDRVVTAAAGDMQGDFG